MKKKTCETAKTFTDLTGFTTRCYENDQLIYFYSSVKYPDTAPDLFEPYLNRLKELDSPIGYIKTKNCVIFGIVNVDPIYVVVGPVLSKNFSARQITAIINKLDFDKSTSDYIREFLENSKHLSIQSLIPILMNMYIMFRFKDLDPSFTDNRDLTLVTKEFFVLDDSSDESIYQTISISNYFDDMIISGDIEGMQDWLANSPSMRFCPDVTSSSLRNSKNSFLIASTLASRSAMIGGLDRIYALKVHHHYIKKSEEMQDEKDLYILTQQMFLDYTEKVSKIKRIETKSNLVSDALNYIHSHMYSSFRTEDIAKALFVSRAYLSTMFHNETGRTISSYIRDEKVEEAKKLLKRTDQPLSLISSDLGFSSQSYFTRVFKQVTGMTPNEFRNKK